jgi:hypothetical protein
MAFDNSPDRNGMYPMIGTTGGGCSESERLPVRRRRRILRGGKMTVFGRPST